MHASSLCRDMCQLFSMSAFDTSSTYRINSPEKHYCFSFLRSSRPCPSEEYAYVCCAHPDASANGIVVFRFITYTANVTFVVPYHSYTAHLSSTQTSLVEYHAPMHNPDQLFCPKLLPRPENVQAFRPYMHPHHLEHLKPQSTYSNGIRNLHTTLPNSIAVS